MLDFFAVGGLLTPEQRAIQQTTRTFVDREVLPGIRDWWDRDEFPLHLVRTFAELGIDSLDGVNILFALDTMFSGDISVAAVTVSGAAA